jgi:hypothetical protein
LFGRPRLPPQNDDDDLTRRVNTSSDPTALLLFDKGVSAVSDRSLGEQQGTARDWDDEFADTIDGGNSDASSTFNASELGTSDNEGDGSDGDAGSFPNLASLRATSSDEEGGGGGGDGDGGGSGAGGGRIGGLNTGRSHANSLLQPGTHISDAYLFGLSFSERYVTKHGPLSGNHIIICCCRLSGLADLPSAMFYAWNLGVVEGEKCSRVESERGRGRNNAHTWNVGAWGGKI